jgi:SAM-dependent methyltransferase
MKCRHCNNLLKKTFLDLGYAPPSNSYLNKKDLSKPEIYYPLKIRVCNKCWLVQTEDYVKAETFFTPDYAYFSSISSSWLLHAKKYSDKIIKELNLNKKSYVVEIASNDGYLLKNFIQKKIPCLGIEPTKSTADVAQKLKIPVIRKFFTKSLSNKITRDGKKADLIIGNNVFAHVPDINDFTKGIKVLLKQGGIVTLEFPHLMRLIEKRQFDTIYHEHFSYLSLNTINNIFSTFGLRIWKVEELSTHGGSLRVYGCHENDGRQICQSVNKILKEEVNKGLLKLKTYINFQKKIEQIKDNFLSFLIKQKRLGKKIVAYGAAAKGNTLLNFSGVKPDLLPFVFDAAKSKQGKFLPGSHIPILPPKELTKIKPDFLLILPWNIINEIKFQNPWIKKKKIKLVIAVPKLLII